MHKIVATRPGLEPGQQYSTSGEPAKCAAEINALGPNTGPIDPDLREVINAWPTLPEAVQRDVVALIRAAGMPASRRPGE